MLSARYSLAQAKEALTHKTRLLTFALLIILAYFLDKNLNSSIVFVFALHHSFNETFIFKTKDKLTQGGRFIFNYSVYSLLLFSDQRINFLPQSLLTFSMVASFIFISYSTLKQKSIGFELIAILIVLLKFIYNFHVEFLDLLLYHTFFWFFYPLVKFSNKKRKLYLFVTENLIVFSLFIFFIYGQMKLSETNALYYYQLLTFWGFVHILTSVGLSRLNPQFINHIFIKK